MERPFILRGQQRPEGWSGPLYYVDSRDPKDGGPFTLCGRQTALRPFILCGQQRPEGWSGPLYYVDSRDPKDGGPFTLCGDTCGMERPFIRCGQQRRGMERPFILSRLERPFILCGQQRPEGWSGPLYYVDSRGLQSVAPLLSLLLCELWPVFVTSADRGPLRHVQHLTHS